MAIEQLAGQERMFRLAVEAIHVAAHFVPGQGWSVSVSTRRGDEAWEDARKSVYSWLQTPELVDVIEAELIRELGL